MKGFAYFAIGAFLGILIDIPILIFLWSTEWGSEFFGTGRRDIIVPMSIAVLILLPLTTGAESYKKLSALHSHDSASFEGPRVHISKVFRVTGFLLLPVIGFFVAWMLSTLFAT
jgi:hypothetical protein